MRSLFVPNVASRTLLVVCGAALLSVVAAPAPRSATDPGPRVFDSGQLDQLPIPLSQTGPTYPMALKMKGVQGEVMVDFLVLPDGTVKSAQASDNSLPEFAAAAVAAVSQWTFKPGRLGGQPVTTKMRVPIVFSLSPSQPEAIDLAIGPLEYTTNMRTRAQQKHHQQEQKSPPRRPCVLSGHIAQREAVIGPHPIAPQRVGESLRRGRARFLPLC